MLVRIIFPESTGYRGCLRFSNKPIDVGGIISFGKLEQPENPEQPKQLAFRQKDERKSSDFLSSFLLAEETLWYNIKNTFIWDHENKGIRRIPLLDKGVL